MELKITMNQSGRIDVTGPIEDLILCFGLLEAAKVQLIDFHRQRAVKGPGIELASGPAAHELLKANGRY